MDFSKYDFSSLKDSAINANDFLQTIIDFAQRLFYMLSNFFKQFSAKTGYELKEDIVIPE